MYSEVFDATFKIFFRYSTNMAKVAKAAASNISIICCTNLKDNLTKTPAGGGHRNHYLWHPVLADSRYVVTVCCLSEISARLINTATDTIRRRQCQLTHTHTHPLNSHLSGTTQVSRYQKGKTNMDFTEARDSEWQCNPLGHMQVCTSLQSDNNASTIYHSPCQ